MKEILSVVKASFVGINGVAFAIKDNKLLQGCFNNKTDVYGDTVNTCAKEFIELIKNKKSHHKNPTDIYYTKTASI